MLSLFEILAGLLSLTATFAWLNNRLLRLPANIGLLTMGLCASLLLLGIEFAFPNTQIYGALASSLRQIDFYDAVMHGMLAFLLFAGALQINLGRLRRRAPVVAILATVGVALSTMLIATGLWLIAQLLGLPLTFDWALVFGALIAPTDPVAVISTLKAVDVSDTLETDMTGEALFNDGIAVVLFTIMLQAAVSPENGFDIVHAVPMLFVEAGGGAILGLLTGMLAYRALQAIDDYSTEVMISLALVTATYAIADELHISGPISVVVAGVLIGNRGAAYAMSDLTKRYVFGFWTLVDDILNAVLFLLIGLEVLILHFDSSLAWAGPVAVPLVTAARFVSVGLPLAVLRRWRPFEKGTVAAMTWGGIRGGISIALALSLPDGPARSVILSATYCVVLFTVIVQGLSLGWLLRHTAAVRER